MLRRTPGLTRPALKWVSQVAASLGATLSATLIWSAVPHPGAAVSQPSAVPELTSGGKFAARAVQPAAPVAYDGLDTMPLPHPAPAPARFVAISFESPSVAGAPAAALRRPAGDPAPERRASRRAPTRPEAHADARRAEPAAPTAPAVSPTLVAAEDGPTDGSFLRRVMPSSLPSLTSSLMPSVLPAIASTARNAWTATASAGDALVARVVPRMP